MTKKKVSYDYGTTVMIRKKLEVNISEGTGTVSISATLAQHLVGICKEHEHYEKQFQEQLLQEL